MLELEMPTIEVSEQLKGSPAEAALRLEARMFGSVAPYTDEQLKAIRPIPGNGSPFDPLEAYHIPFRLIADPVAAARARERRRKMFALTSVRANKIPPFSHTTTTAPAPIF